MHTLANLMLVAALVCQQDPPSDHRAERAEVGLGVDRSGNPVVDPTKNVLDLSAAAAKRADDLRAADLRYLDLALRRLDDLRTAELLRIDQLRLKESERMNEQLSIRAELSGQLISAEAKRLDDIRAVDASAVSVASQRASDQALVLAAQVASSAEALRSLVATTAATVATSQQQLATTLTARLTVLEQAQYEGKGRQAYTDPQVNELLSEVKALRLSQSQVTGQGEGSSVVIAYIIAGAGVAIGAYGLLRKPPENGPERPAAGRKAA